MGTDISRGIPPWKGIDYAVHGLCSIIGDEGRNNKEVRIKMSIMKKILDVCCGSRMFWFNKNHPDVETLFGHTTGRHGKKHWITFMKET